VYDIKRRKVDPEYKLLTNIRTRVNRAIATGFKTGSTVEMLGCSIPELKRHLESKFTEGMNWDNYGRFGWHIDHIIPCSAFNISDKKEQFKCFHFSNLQPLWAEDNLKKHAKILI
jgi:hypothetical protein